MEDREKDAEIIVTVGQTSPTKTPISSPYKGSDSGMNFTPFARKEDSFKTVFVSTSTTEDAATVPSFSPDTNITNFGFREALRILEGAANIGWAKTIRHSLWIGTDAGSLVLLGIRIGFLNQLRLSDDPLRVDAGAQKIDAPVVAYDSVFQVSDNRRQVYQIFDSDELKRKEYELVTSRIEIDYFIEAPNGSIKKAFSSPSSGYLCILTEGGNIFLGTLRRDNIAFTELSFGDVVEDANIIGNTIHISTPYRLYSCNLSVVGPIEEVVPLLFTPHSPYCAFINTTENNLSLGKDLPFIPKVTGQVKVVDAILIGEMGEAVDIAHPRTLTVDPEDGPSFGIAPPKPPLVYTEQVRPDGGGGRLRYKTAGVEDIRKSYTFSFPHIRRRVVLSAANAYIMDN